MANPTDPKPSEGSKDEKGTQSSTSDSAAKSDETPEGDRSKCIDDYKANQLPDHTAEMGDIKAVEEEDEITNDDELEAIHSWSSLESSNLSVDARACRMPKRKPKDAITAEEKLCLAYSEDEKQETDFDKKKEKKGKNLERLELESFIKTLVRNQNSEVKFFDAAILYDKNDYESVTDFKQELIAIANINLNEDLRIELFDSEEFAQSKIMVVEDVITRCSVVLVYLTRNFTSPEVNLFIEEAIGLSRFGLGSESLSSQNQWVLKPVHTLSRKSRDYKTPVGLITVNGIDWFDRSSSHTMNQITKILQTAIVQRKGRDSSYNTSLNYKHVFGSVPEMPSLGPPFNKPRNVQNFSFPPLPVQHSTAPLILPPSYDVISPTYGSQVFPSRRNDPTAVRTDTQPSFSPDIRQTNVAQAAVLNDSFTQSRLGFSNQANAYPPYDMPPPYSPYTDQQSIQTPVERHHFGQSVSYNVPTSQPGHIYQSAGLPVRGFSVYQPPERLSDIPMHTGQSAGQPVQMNMRQSQMPVYPANMNVHRTNSYESYQSQQMSRDAFQSESGNFLLDQRNDTPASSHLSVVSQVSGNLITKTNLSADDDVEVDTRSKTGHITHTSKDPRRIPPVSHDSEDSSDESDYSSDSDSDLDFPAHTKVVKKVVNIVGCKTVQLGKDNTVKESGRKEDNTDKLSKKQSEKNERAQEKQASKQNVLTGSTTSKMNISFSDDSISAGNIVPNDSNYNLGNRYSSEKTNPLSSDSSIKTKRLEPEKSNKHKINTKLKVSIDREKVNTDNRIEDNGVCSPDDNISEDQLFGSGSLSIDTNSVSSYNIGLSPEAPFSFSQGIQHARDLRHIFHPCLCIKNSIEKTCDSKTCVTNEVD